MNNLFSPVFPAGEAITLGAFFACIGAAALCGILTAFAAGCRAHLSRSMTVSVILLPPIVAALILMTQNNLAAGIAVLGAVSIVRFRSVPGKARDIVSIFLAITAGVACANGYLAVAFLVVAVICSGMTVLAFLPLPDDREYDLRLTVPETLNFTGLFDDLLNEYTSSYRLVTVKTSNMGSLYRLQYRVVLRDPAKARDLIDGLRCRNGNLEISVTEAGSSDADL